MEDNGRGDFTGDAGPAESATRKDDAAKPEDAPLDEAKRLRRLQVMMDMVLQVMAQDANMTVDEASQMAADARRAALTLFPGKELAFDLIYRPRLQRLMRERYRIQ